MHSTSVSSRPIRMELTKILDSCRVCMCRSVNMKSIFDPKHENIIEQIHFCTGITPKKGDGLPSIICKSCLKNLSISFKFKTSCLLANETFQKLIKPPLTTIKKEELDNNDDEFDDTADCHDDLTDCDEKVIDKVINLSVGLGKDEVKVPVLSTESKSMMIKDEVESVQPPPINRRIGRPPGPKRRYKKNRFKRLHCEPCAISFKTKAQSNQHKKEMHKDSETWVCEICGKFFMHRASHYTHMRSHQPPQYGCDQCDYKTWHKHDLVKHIRIHTGNKMYQCEYCTHSFYTSSNLRGHIRRSHMNERRYACTMCRKTFFDKTKLNRHIDSHNDIKRYECEICHSSFTRRCYWKKHLLSQHNIDTPAQRPGRQKTNLVIGEHLINHQVSKICQMGQNGQIGQNGQVGQNGQIGQIRQVGQVIVIGHDKDYCDRKELILSCI